MGLKGSKHKKGELITNLLKKNEGHRQTVQAQIRCCTMPHLIRVSTVYLQKVLLEFEPGSVALQ